MSGASETRQLNVTSGFKDDFDGVLSWLVRKVETSFARTEHFRAEITNGVADDDPEGRVVWVATIYGSWTETPEG